MRATLLTAQKMADSIVHEAEAKRDEILALAKKRLEVVKKTHPKAFLADPDEVSVIYLLAEEAEFYYEYATFG